jgi:fatty acid-binding protein DegV
LGDRPARVAAIHAHDPEAAERVRAALAERVNAPQIIVSELSVGIAVHLGPGTVGVVGYNP